MYSSAIAGYISISGGFLSHGESPVVTMDLQKNDLSHGHRLGWNLHIVPSYPFGIHPWFPHPRLENRTKWRICLGGISWDFMGTYGKLIELNAGFSSQVWLSEGIHLIYIFRNHGKIKNMLNSPCCYNTHFTVSSFRRLRKKWQKKSNGPTSQFTQTRSY